MPTGQPTLGRLNSAASCLNIRTHYKERRVEQDSPFGKHTAQRGLGAYSSDQGDQPGTDPGCVGPLCRQDSAISGIGHTRVIVIGHRISTRCKLNGCSQLIGSGFLRLSEPGGQRMPLRRGLNDPTQRQPLGGGTPQYGSPLRQVAPDTSTPSRAAAA